MTRNLDDVPAVVHGHFYTLSAAVSRYARRRIPRSDVTRARVTKGPGIQAQPFGEVPRGTGTLASSLRRCAHWISAQMPIEGLNASQHRDSPLVPIWSAACCDPSSNPRAARHQPTYSHSSHQTTHEASRSVHMAGFIGDRDSGVPAIPHGPRQS